jgi:hypothetical protein
MQNIFSTGTGFLLKAGKSSMRFAVPCSTQLVITAHTQTVRAGVHHLLRLSLLQAWRSSGVLLNEVLQIVCSLLAHRKFGELLVDQGGVQLLLAVPR